MEENIKNPFKGLKENTAAHKTNQLLMRVAIAFAVVGVLSILWSFARISALKEDYSRSTEELQKSNTALRKNIDEIKSALKTSDRELESLRETTLLLKQKIRHLFKDRQNLSHHYSDALAREEALSANILNLTVETTNLKKQIAARGNDDFEASLDEEIDSTSNQAMRDLLEYTRENIEKIKKGESISLEPIVINTAHQTTATGAEISVVENNLIPQAIQPSSPYAPAYTGSSQINPMFQLPQNIPLSPELKKIAKNPHEYITGQIIKFDSRHDLLVINRGINEGVVEGMVGRIIKNGAVIGRAEVLNARNKLSAAFLQPTEHKNLIGENDQVAFKRIYNY